MLHSSVGGMGDAWVAATDEDDLAVDQTDLGLFSACAVVEKI